jgi:hypothetical protein
MWGFIHDFFKIHFWTKYIIENPRGDSHCRKCNWCGTHTRLSGTGHMKVKFICFLFISKSGTTARPPRHYKDTEIVCNRQTISVKALLT